MDTKSINDDDSCSSIETEFAFANLNFSGVDFGSDSEKRNVQPTEELNVEVHAGGCEKSSTNCPIRMQKDKVHNKETNDQAHDSVSNVQEISAKLDTDVYNTLQIAPSRMDEEAKICIEEEENILLHDCYVPENDKRQSAPSRYDSVDKIREMSKRLSNGQYIDILNGDSTKALLNCDLESLSEFSVAQQIRHCVYSYCTSVAKCVEAEMIAVAALNLFMQANYTGPALNHGGTIRPGSENNSVQSLLADINPHRIFHEKLKVSQSTGGGQNMNRDENNDSLINSSFQNAVLGELSVEGEWPCSVSKYPYFLLLSRSILAALASPNRPDWTYYIESMSDSKVTLRKNQGDNPFEVPPPLFVSSSQNLSCVQIWNSRAIVAHNRTLLSDEFPSSLWEEAKCAFEKRLIKFCGEENYEKENKTNLTFKTLLEYGLAEHHFDKNKKGKTFFSKAIDVSDLNIEITGSEGRRTKYQKRAVAQYLVRAKPKAEIKDNDDIREASKQSINKQEIKFNEDAVLLDKVKFVADDDNIHHNLSILQLTLLLALCLDVKNENPMDGLTGEQMGAFLERVLQQHDDWMVYATGLLERAWLESERNHTKERAILQLQALVDQHSNRLTLTQSTFKAAVEDSAPPQERLRHIHYIVYPPRWVALRDLAERYARLGIVTSAAEIFEEIEMWDEVVECYRRAGKENMAEKVVRRRLQERETPRMWAALGDITNDPSCYEKALLISNGKYSDAHVALGKYHQDKDELKEAAKHFKKAVEIKPLSPYVWFRLGTLSMMLQDWQTALQSFTEVVQQEPEESDAWANVAAVHMHNKNPGEAYPALNESLKLNRKNWRVWVSKLYTCMDLKKYDEAIQACNVLLDFKSKNNSADSVPDLEEKLVRALVGASLHNHKSALEKNDVASIESAERTLNRLRDLLLRMQSIMKETWLYELCSVFNESVGNPESAIENLMKEYRSLQSYKGWEIDNKMLDRACRVLNQVANIHVAASNIEELKKLKVLLNGMDRKIKAAYFGKCENEYVRANEF